MNRVFNKKINVLILSGLVTAVVLGTSIHSAWSYFTTYARAEGGYTVELGDETTITEEFSDWTKHVSISNSSESQPVFIRARAYSGSKYELAYSDTSGLWTPDADGWYYYQDPVGPDGATEELLVQINGITEEDKDDFNVIVIYESTPVLYDEDGTPYADWTAKVTTGQTEGGR